MIKFLNILRLFFSISLLALSLLTSLFSVSVKAMAADDAPNAPTYRLSPLNQYISRFIGSREDVDWFAFRLVSPGDIVVNLTNLPRNCRLDLYNSSGVRIGSSNRPNRYPERIVRNELHPGTYKVRVSGVSGTFTPRSRYTLRCGFTPNNWTIMAYLDGDNDLESSILEDLGEMKKRGSTNRVNVLAQLDTLHSNPKRYLVLKNSTKLLVNLSEQQSMGSVSTLEAFIRWTKYKFPAQNYFLILNDHGSGWINEEIKSQALALRTKKRPVKAICWDDTNGGDFLSIAELSTALSHTFTTGKKLSILGLDACLMAMVEVDNQVRPYVNCRVASEATEPGSGWPYDRLVSAVASYPNLSPFALAKSVVSSYTYFYTNIEPSNRATLSAMKLGPPYGNLNSAITSFADALRTNMSGSFSKIEKALNDSDYFEVYYIDLGDFARKISRSSLLSSNLKSSALSLLSALASARISNFSGSQHAATGASIYFPKYPSMWTQTKSSYRALRFSANHWDETIQAFMNRGGVSYSDNNNDISSSVDILSGAKISDTLDESNDKDDVYRIYLKSGQALTTTLNSDDPSGTDFDLYLYGPGTPSVNSSEYLRKSDSAIYPDSIVYAAETTGYHYIDVYAGAGAGRGSYYLTAQVE